MLKFIVKLHPEIAIKSRSVRKRFTKVLENNIKIVLRRIDEKVQVRNNWDNISVVTLLEGEQTRATFIDSLARIPGIVQFIEVTETSFETLDDIYKKTIELVGHTIEGCRHGIFRSIVGVGPPHVEPASVVYLGEVS